MRGERDAALRGADSQREARIRPGGAGEAAFRFSFVFDVRNLKHLRKNLYFCTIRADGRGRSSVAGNTLRAGRADILTY